MNLRYKLEFSNKNGIAISLLERFNNPWTGAQFYSVKETYRPFAWYYRLQRWCTKTWTKKSAPAGKLVSIAETPEMKQKVAEFIETMKVNPNMASAAGQQAMEAAERDTSAYLDDREIRPMPTPSGKIVVDADTEVWTGRQTPVVAGGETVSDAKLQPHINWTFEVPVKKVPHVQ
jgi:hypothetical protein